MKITIHRGTHQIGGISTEICTENGRILIDMGEELSCDLSFASTKLSIDGVTDKNGKCDAVLFTHYHGDHTGQMMNIREDIPLYIGALAKEILLKSVEKTHPKDTAFINRIKGMSTFDGGDSLMLGDIRVTPYSIDHSACDSYMFLIEAEGKRILYTGDFRTHGFRGKAIPKILGKIGKVDVVITEGTTFSRPCGYVVTERELQGRIKAYMDRYKYVYVLCASTNLERICALSKATPRGKYFVCDQYQYELLDLIEAHWQKHSPLYRNLKKCYYSDKIKQGMEQRGFLMMVRDNESFRKIMSQFDSNQSIILYSMWNGYRTNSSSTIPDFLKLAGVWEPFHTSGHASPSDVQKLINAVKPSFVIPIHTDAPEKMNVICGAAQTIVATDGEEIIIDEEHKRAIC